MIEQELLDPETIHAYQAWVCREDHFDHEGHEKTVAHLEEEWKQNYRSREHDGLCALPNYLRQSKQGNLWTSPDAWTIVEATADAADFPRLYKEDAQYVFSRCQHHIHLPNPRTGVREPLRGCRSKKCRNKCIFIMDMKFLLRYKFHLHR